MNSNRTSVIKQRISYKKFKEIGHCGIDLRKFETTEKMKNTRRNKIE